MYEVYLFDEREHIICRITIPIKLQYIESHRNKLIENKYIKHTYILEKMQDEI